MGSLSWRLYGVLNEFWFICLTSINLLVYHWHFDFLAVVMIFLSVAVKRQTKGGPRDIGFLTLIKRSMFRYNIGILTARHPAWKYCWLSSCWELCSHFSVLQQFILLIIHPLLHLGIVDCLFTSFQLIKYLVYFLVVFSFCNSCHPEIGFPVLEFCYCLTRTRYHISFHACSWIV